MVLELCERGALDELLKRNTKLKEKYVSKFILQLTNGLKYLHNTMSVVHRDLKLGNLFLDGQLNIKIGDFGLSAIIKDGEKRKTVCGTPNYIAPEVLFGKTGGHSFEADIWSVGVIIYTLLIGTPPFQQKSVEAIYKQIELNKYIFPSDCDLSSDAIDLISKILISNPQDRPDLDQILSHVFLQQKENLAYRVYRNLFTRSYKLSDFPEDYVIYSIPINSIKGIGYILSSGICGVYYQDLNNVYIKNNSLIYIRLKLEDGRKVFVTEEHLLSSIPETLKICYENVLYFINTYGNFILRRSPVYLAKFAAGGSKENLNNISKSELTNTGGFVAKVKKIKDGLLFIMTNNIFIFDFTDGSKVVVGKDGKCVYVFNDDGLIKFSDRLLDNCLAVLKMYSNSSK